MNKKKPTLREHELLIQFMEFLQAHGDYLSSVSNEELLKDWDKRND